MPEISVIVPVYKVEKYIHRCIDSILAQTFTDFELILVDDGSPDNCPAICDEYAKQDSRVVVIHQENGGLSAARNAGIDWVFANSDSQWLTFIDSDDWVHPRYVELLYGACSMREIDIAICQHIETNDSNVDETLVDLAENIKIVCMNVTDMYCAEDLGVAYNAAWGKLFRKSIFREFRYPVGVICEDLHAIPETLFVNSDILLVNAPLYYYYINPNGIIRSKWTPKKMDQITGYEKLLKYFSAVGNKKAYYCVIGRFVRVLATQSLAIRQMALPTYKTFLRTLHFKMMYIVVFHGKKLSLNVEKDGWVFEQAFPLLMGCYWFFKGQWNKRFK